MGERLELSWERIREIPEEVNRDTQHGTFFASLSVFFLQFLKGREEENFNKESLSAVLTECLRNCSDYLFPQDALQKMEEGDILSVLLYLSLGLVYEKEEEAVCRVLELFIELYLLFRDSSFLDRQRVKDVLYVHFYDYAGDFLEEWFIEDKWTKAEMINFHNPLFPLFFPFKMASTFFTEEYEEAHRNDLALILGDRLLSHLKQELEKLRKRVDFKPISKEKMQSVLFITSIVRKACDISLEESDLASFEPVNWSDSPHALAFHSHQIKLLKKFREEFFLC